MRTLAKMGWGQERFGQVIGPLVPYPSMDTKEATGLSPLVLLADMAAPASPMGWPLSPSTVDMPPCPSQG